MGYFEELANNTNSIIVMGIALAVYELVIVMLYYFLSTPGLLVLWNIIELEKQTIPEAYTYGPPILSVFNMMFAVAFVIPIVLFIVWVYRQESGYITRRF